MRKMLQVLIILVAAGIMGCSADTKQTEEKEEFVPTPLVIETEEVDEDIEGYYKATISTSGDPTEPKCYEGVIRIDVDGEYLRITASDLVRSDFDKLF